MSSRMLLTLSVLLLSMPLGTVAEQAVSGPSDEFLMSRVVVKTGTGTFDPSMRLIEFINGIRPPKQWEKISDGAWILRTEYLDPVINEKRHYTLTFQKTTDSVVLTRGSFSGHALSDDEIVAFAKQMVRNYEQHISAPK
jgi:hypothetical protein